MLIVIIHYYNVRLPLKTVRTAGKQILVKGDTL